MEKILISYEGNDKTKFLDVQKFKFLEVRKSDNDKIKVNDEPSPLNSLLSNNLVNDIVKDVIFAKDAGNFDRSIIAEIKEKYLESEDFLDYIEVIEDDDDEKSWGKLNS